METIIVDNFYIKKIYSNPLLKSNMTLFMNGGNAQEFKDSHFIG